MNISAFDLNLLPVFEALLEERSVTRAAARVGLSQPALSNAIRRLRDSLADPLFVRSAHGMQPTPRAEQLAAAVRASLAQARLLLSENANFDIRAAQRTFRVAMDDCSEWRIGVPLVRRISDDSQGVRLQVRRVDALFAAPETELRSGEFDIAIGFFPDPRTLSEGTMAETFYEEDNVVVARRGHPAFKQPLTAERFASLEHAAVMYRADAWGLIDQELAALGLRRQLRFATPHFLVAVRAVQRSDLVVCLPERFAREFRDQFRLATRPVPFNLPRFATRMVWARQFQDDRAHVWLREQVRAAATSSAIAQRR